MLQERRLHARLDTDVLCRCSTERARFEAHLRDLSMSGALLDGPPSAIEPGDIVLIELDWAEQDDELEAAPASLLAEAVRVRTDGPASAWYGLKFVSRTPHEEELLTGYIERLLARPGSGGRLQPRVRRRIGLRCRSARDSYAMMIDISRDGLGLVSETPLAAGEALRVDVVVEGFDGDSLALAATVVYARPLTQGQFHVGLRFGPLGVSQQNALDRLVRVLLGVKQQ